MRLTPLLTVTAAVFAVVAGLAAPTAAAAEVAPPAAPAPAAAEAAAPAAAAPDTTQDSWRLRGDLAAHDPALVKGGGGKDWYVFATGQPDKSGGTIEIRSSPDGRNWTYAGNVWGKIPAWISTAVPGINNLWAPEIYQHDGTYYLYYAASTWGKNNSLIGLATNTTLDPTDPAYNWVDQGQVVRSLPASNFNAIDPGVVEDASGTPWLAFGSYWTGIQMVQLEWPSGKRSADKSRVQLADRKVAPNAVEAPYIVPHDGWYYLFTSWGQCCQGVNSDYKIVVGRSQQVNGGYVDQDGRALTDGGGTVLKAASGSRVGPGGQSVSKEIIAYHYYDAKANGAPTLGLQRVSWGEDGWPELSGAASKG